MTVCHVDDDDVLESSETAAAKARWMAIDDGRNCLRGREKKEEEAMLSAFPNFKQWESHGISVTRTET